LTSFSPRKSLQLKIEGLTNEGFMGENIAPNLQTYTIKDEFKNIKL
jgi:hypothetical protein